LLDENSQQSFIPALARVRATSQTGWFGLESLPLKQLVFNDQARDK
jgi:hypothetical protein